jgi:ABC-2 type transport system permease protein
VSSALTVQVGALARRGVLRTARQPAQIVPAVVFPLFLLAVNTGGLGDVPKLPGFPADSFVSFAIAVPFVQAALFAVSGGGTDLARDIETGFLDRMALTPLSGFSLVAGQLAGVVALGCAQAVIYLVVGLAAGSGFEAGLAGVPVLFVLSLLIAFSFGCIGVFMALRLGSGEAVQSMFPVLFVFLFLSSMNLPRNLIETDWFRTIATYNPVSYLIEAVRSLFITGWDAEALALGFGCAFAIGAIFLTAAAMSLRKRITRT